MHFLQSASLRPLVTAGGRAVDLYSHYHSQAHSLRLSVRVGSRAIGGVAHWDGRTHTLQRLNTIATTGNTLSSHPSMSTSAPSEAVRPSGPMERAIESKLLSTFQPIYLQTINESHMHSVPRNSETHFKVIIVSEAFEGMKLLARHRAVNAALATELQNGVHALSITARTVAQWETEQGRKIEPSPNCMGGAKHDVKQQKLRQSADSTSASFS